MNSPIALRGFDEDEYRNRVRLMSDQELIAREVPSLAIRQRHNCERNAVRFL